MNKVILIGNLTRDPETRTTPNGINCCQFGIAVQRRFANAQGQREADFFNVVAWRQTGDLCQKYLSKGRKVCVEGSIQIRTYDAQDGTKRTIVEVTAENVEFLSSANEGRPAGNYAGNSSYSRQPAAQPEVSQQPIPSQQPVPSQQPAAYQAQAGFEQAGQDDDLPF